MFKYCTYILSLMLITSISTGCTSKKPHSKPNILFIIVDDLRPELGCYGVNQVISPEIDKFASESVMFERAYAQIPICMPSRVSLLTGVHPISKSFDADLKRGDKDFPNLETLPEYLKKKGYYTISNGKVFHTKEDSDLKSWSEPAWRPETKPVNNFLDEDSKNKYQRYSSYTYIDKSTQEVKKVEGYRGPFVESPDVPDNAYVDGMILEKSIQDLKKLSQKNAPFFLAVGFNKPHLPFYAPKKYWDMYNPDSIRTADNRYFPINAPEQLKPSEELKNLYHHKNIEYNSDEFHKTALHGYYACISYIDKLVGDLLNEVKELGLEENTIVVLLGDHGFHLGEHNMWGKHNTLNNALITPLMFKIPGTKASKDTKLSGLIDIYPTICNLVGIAVPEHVHGRNLFSELSDNEIPDAVFFLWNGQEAVKTNQYLYSEWKDKEGEIIGQMLFDHFKDPNENNNIAYREEYKTIVERLSNLLKKKKNNLK